MKLASKVVCVVAVCALATLSVAGGSATGRLRVPMSGVYADDVCLTAAILWSIATLVLPAWGLIAFGRTSPAAALFSLLFSGGTAACCWMLFLGIMNAV